ncbi:MAG: hypothetical protein K6A44_07130 [bacterium]|nr:hypothetical protein [bacterium]
MEINKITFEQLADKMAIESSFEDLDVNDDNVINEQDVQAAASNQTLAANITNLLNSVDEEDELSPDADFDYDDTVVNTTDNNTNVATTVSNSSTSSQVSAALTQFEINKLNDRQSEIQSDIEAKQKECETKQKKIEEKQEELEALVKAAQNNNDNSKTAQITDLQAEIKTLAAEIEELLSSIEKLESDYKANSLMLTSLTESLETQQTALTQEVSEVNATTTINGITSTDGANSASSTKTLKSMDEYMTMMDEKFADLFCKLESMDAQSVSNWLGTTADGKRYAGPSATTKSNSAAYYDADGDGRVTVIDQLLWQNYLEKYKSSNSAQSINQTGMGRGLYIMTGRLNAAVLGNYYGTTYDLDDLEQIDYLKKTSEYSDKLNPGVTAQINLNITKIAQNENWEERLDNLSSQKWFTTKFGKDYACKLKEQITEAKDFISKNPENAKFAGIAAAFNIYKNNIANESKMIELFETDGGKHVWNTTLEDAERIASEFGISVSQAQNMLNGEKIQRQFKNTLKYACDINGDGIFDHKDLNELSGDLDLDGDGCISSEEKSFLEILKAQLYSKATINHVNASDDIDDVISYCEFTNNNSVTSELASDFRARAQELAEQYDKDLSEYTNDDGLYISGSNPPEGKKSWDNGNAAQGMFGKLAWYWETSASYSKYGVVTSKGVADVLTPTYNLKWRIENGNLSKTELQTIIDKINAASSSVQSQLADIKKAAETKLASMS